MAASEDKFYWIVASQRQLQKIYDLSYKFQVPHILHFLLWRQVKEERIFVDIFLGKGFREKCKHTEIAWNIIILVF